MKEIAALRLEDDALSCPPLNGAPGADPRLVEEGWEPRFLADPSRCEEATALYRDLGFDVRAEPVPAAQLGSYCEACQAAVCHVYHMIYTRGRSR